MGFLGSLAKIGQAAAGPLNTVGQFAVPAIATAGYLFDPMRKRNRQQIKGLESDIEEGKGLDEREKQLLSTTGMRGVRSQTGSMASEMARLQAASGGLGGGAAMAQTRDAIAGQIGSQAEKVGSRIGAADLDALAGKREELEARYDVAQKMRNDYLSSMTGWAGKQLEKMGQQKGVGATGGTAAGADAGSTGAATPAAPAAPAAPSVAETMQRSRQAASGRGALYEAAPAPAAAARTYGTQEVAMARASVTPEQRGEFDSLLARGMSPEAARLRLMGSMRSRSVSYSPTMGETPFAWEP